VNPRVGVALIFFYVQPIGSSEQLPIEMPQIVAGHVRPMLGEVSREAEIRRAMKPRDEAFDDRASDQLKRAYARKDFRREETSSSRVRSCGSHLLDDPHRVSD
jgi:hypothetical protein